MGQVTFRRPGTVRETAPLLAGVSPEAVSPSRFYHAAANVLNTTDKHHSPRQAVLRRRSISFYQVLKTQSNRHCIEFIGYFIVIMNIIFLPPSFPFLVFFQIPIRAFEKKIRNTPLTCQTAVVTQSRQGCRRRGSMEIGTREFIRGGENK